MKPSIRLLWIVINALLGKKINHYDSVKTSFFTFPFFDGLLNVFASRYVKLVEYSLLNFFIKGELTRVFRKGYIPIALQHSNLYYKSIKILKRLETETSLVAITQRGFLIQTIFFQENKKCAAIHSHYGFLRNNKLISSKKIEEVVKKKIDYSKIDKITDEEMYFVLNNSLSIMKNNLNFKLILSHYRNETGIKSYQTSFTKPERLQF